MKLLRRNLAGAGASLFFLFLLFSFLLLLEFNSFERVLKFITWNHLSINLSLPYLSITNSLSSLLIFSSDHPKSFPLHFMAAEEPRLEEYISLTCSMLRCVTWPVILLHREKIPCLTNGVSLVEIESPWNNYSQSVQCVGRNLGSHSQMNLDHEEDDIPYFPHARGYSFGNPSHPLPLPT